jgi:hypothetical protein
MFKKKLHNIDKVDKKSFLSNDSFSPKHHSIVFYNLDALWFWVVEIESLNFILMNFVFSELIKIGSPVSGIVPLKSIQIVGPTTFTELFHKPCSKHTEFICYRHNDQKKSETLI